MATGKQKLGALIGAAAAGLCVYFIQPLEGTVFETYPDAIGVLTACTGHTGPELKMGQTFTPQECTDTLSQDLLVAARGVLQCTHVPLSVNEKAAFISFAFNVGVKNYCGSTLVAMLNAGDHYGACKQLLRWNRASGVVLRGLTNRRKAEEALCLKP
jgi:lysozyme